MFFEAFGGTGCNQDLPDKRADVLNRLASTGHRHLLVPVLEELTTCESSKDLDENQWLVFRESSSCF